MNQLIFLQGKLADGVVHKDGMYSKPYENPVPGNLGYFLREANTDERLVYGVYKEIGIWHCPHMSLEFSGIEIERQYRELRGKMLVEAQ